MRTLLTLIALVVGLLCGACGDAGYGLAPSSLPKPAGIVR